MPMFVLLLASTRLEENDGQWRRNYWRNEKSKIHHTQFIDPQISVLRMLDACSSACGSIEHRSSTLTLTFLGSAWTGDFFWQLTNSWNALPARLIHFSKQIGKVKMLQSVRTLNSIYARWSGTCSYSNRSGQFNFVRTFATKQNKIRLDLAPL